MAFLFAASSGFTLPQAAPAVVMARPQFSAAAPVMMAKESEPWSIDTVLKGPKEKFAGGIELLSGVGRPINGKTVKVDATAYASRYVEKAGPQAGMHLAACGQL